MNGLYPFVRVTAFHLGVYPKAPQLLADIWCTRDADHQELRKDSAHRNPRQGLPSMDDFRADRRYGGDGNRIDLAYALYALGHGGTEDAVGTAICTRDLSKKGSEARQAAYVARTGRRSSAGPADSL